MVVAGSEETRSGAIYGLVSRCDRGPGLPNPIGKSAISPLGSLGYHDNPYPCHCTMTITFVPGEPSLYTQTVAQGFWRSHHIIVYGLGNNLIIGLDSISDHEAHPTIAKSAHLLQTIYLPHNPEAIAFNPDKGLIAVAYTELVLVYAPVNQYMKEPKWHLVGSKLELEGAGRINCLKWAYLENELLVACALCDVYMYGYQSLDEWELRWHKTLPAPVVELEVNADGTVFVTRLVYDRLVKFWQRQNLGVNTMFEVAYIPHPRGSWVTQIHLRGPRSLVASTPLSLTAALMRSVGRDPTRDMRYLAHNNTGSESLHVIYTFTNAGDVYIWGFYDVLGHQHLKQCGHFDIGVGMEPMVIDRSFLGHQCDYDVLMVVDIKQFRRKVYAVRNINDYPPTNIQLAELWGGWEPLPKYTFPIPQENTKPQFPKQLTEDLICSHDYIIQQRPIAFSVDFMWSPSHHRNEDVPPLLLLVHDRIKCTIREDFLCITPQKITLTLLNKLLGNRKLIQKLYRLNTINLASNILLSTSNFSRYNYVWEPLFLGKDPNQRMSLSKRFEIDLGLKDIDANRIMKAVVISDITLADDHFRRHLVVTIDKVGNILVWDCDSKFYEDIPAKLIWREHVDEDNSLGAPRLFVMVPGQNKSVYHIIAVFCHDKIHGWTINVDDKGGVSIVTTPISNLPQEEPIHLITQFNSINPQGNLLSVIDAAGTMRIYGIHFQSKNLEWRLNYAVPTGVRNASKIHGSDVIDRIAVVDELGCNLLIWETRSGLLEYEEKFDDGNRVLDLDWTFVHSGQVLSATNAVLLVGFDRHVLLYTQLRYDYTNKVPTFAVIENVDISNYTLHTIGDLIWVNDCYLVIGCGNQFFIDDKWIHLSNSNQLDLTIRQLLLAPPGQEEVVYDVNHLASVLNGPLPVYHPQIVVQCLYMGQYNFVSDIFVRLFAAIRNDHISWDLGYDLYTELKINGLTSCKGHNRELTPDGYDDHDSNDAPLDVFNKFNLGLAKLLVESLTKVTLPLLTRHQQLTLAVLVLLVAELLKLIVLLDENGLRFLVGFKLFMSNPKQLQLTTRDMLWALHCDNKPMILSVVELEYFKGKVTWNNIRQTLLVYWVDDQKLMSIMEQCVRYQFSELRDPLGVILLIYLALRKKQILLGLWKTVLHPEKTKMVKFLSNDFAQERWRLAANKNAYALLGKHRFLDAAYFFLLGDLPIDCCTTLATKVGDVDLALAVAKLWRVTLYTDDKSAVVSVVENYIVPDAITRGSRWLALWVFWQLGQKELSVQALIKAPMEMFTTNKSQFSTQCVQRHIDNTVTTLKGHSFLRDDPVIALLFNNLRHNKVKYQQGAKGVTPLEEFQFITKNCLIYSRMGCDYMSLVMLRHWQFEHEVIVIEQPTLPAKQRRVSVIDVPNSPIHRRMLINDLKNPPQKQKDKEATSSKVTANKAPPPPSAFEEPDMLGFDFGF